MNKIHKRNTPGVEAKLPVWAKLAFGRTLKLSLAAFLALLCLCVPTRSALAIVTHTDDVLTDHPEASIMGRWSTNASCVAIGPDLVITTAHQGGGVGSMVEIDGASYRVSEYYNSGSDICIARLASDTSAGLSDWIGISYDITAYTEVVIGGYGRSRGSEISGVLGVYGYQWLSECNTTLRWGTNAVDDIDDTHLIADFDGPNIAHATDYEAAIALYDSGGGWFAQIDGQWSLCGLSQGTENSGMSIFANTLGRADADLFSAVALASVSSWIEQMLATLIPVTGDVDGDGDVDFTDLEIFGSNYGHADGASWSQGNFDGDGDVDLVDLGLLASMYGYGLDAAVASTLDFGVDAAAALPEPTSLAILAAGASVLLPRRRKGR